MNTKVINWFEIPVADAARAKSFYEAVFATELLAGPPNTEVPWIFPFDGIVTGGGLTIAAEFEPSDRGAVIYLDGGPDLEGTLARVDAAGGKVTRAKTLITPDIGYYATFIDTEGNRIGLQSDE